MIEAARNDQSCLNFPDPAEASFVSFFSSVVILNFIHYFLCSHTNICLLQIPKVLASEDTIGTLYTIFLLRLF